MSSQSRFQYSEKRNYLSPNNTNEDYNEMIRSMTEILKDSQKDTIIDPVINRFFSLSSFQDNVLPLNIPQNVNGSSSWFSERISRNDRFEALKNTNPRLKQYLEQLKTSHDSVNDDVIHIMDSLVFKTAHNVIQFFALSSILYVMIYMNSDLFGTNRKITFGGKNITNRNTIQQGGAPLFKDVGLMQSLNAGIQNSQVIDQKAIVRDIYDIFQEMNVRNDLYLAHVPGNIQKNKNISKQQDYIGIKEKEFNRRKSYVITMVNKNHRVRDSYDRKYFWTAIQFFILVIITIAFIAIMYSVKNNSLQVRMVGLILLSISAGSLSVMSMYGLLKSFL
tara:strand:+ start:258 stop:1259 length:1002 start_codon:yes stop_codon:yes gene_type:complete